MRHVKWVFGYNVGLLAKGGDACYESLASITQGRRLGNIVTEISVDIRENVVYTIHQWVGIVARKIKITEN